MPCFKSLSNEVARARVPDKEWRRRKGVGRKRESLRSREWKTVSWGTKHEGKRDFM
jgi:hypothetical protein